MLIKIKEKASKGKELVFVCSFFFLAAHRPQPLKKNGKPVFLAY